MDKSKLKPNANFGSKFEKRKQKKEKLMKELATKKDEQIKAKQQNKHVHQDLVSFGNDFSQILAAIQNSPILTEEGKKISEKKMKQNVVSELKQIYNNDELFSNTNMALQQIHKQLDFKAAEIANKQQE